MSTCREPRKNALLKDGNKNDRVDARKLAELLRTNQVKPVYHETHGTRALKEVGRSYLTVTKDVTRVMNRIKSAPRSRCLSIPHIRRRQEVNCAARLGLPLLTLEIC